MVFFYFFSLSSFPDSNFVYKSEVGGIVEARESGEKIRGEIDEGSSQGGRRVLFLEACGDLDQRW